MEWETDLTRRCAWMRWVDWCTWILEISIFQIRRFSFCRNSCHCFCDISAIAAPLCLKFRTEVTSYVPNPTPRVSSKLVSPICIYDPFPKVTCYRTVQNNEVVRTAMWHCFIFWFWNLDQRKYSPWYFCNIFMNSIGTSVVQSIAMFPRCPV